MSSFEIGISEAGTLESWLHCKIGNFSRIPRKSLLVTVAGTLWPLVSTFPKFLLVLLFQNCFYFSKNVYWFLFVNISIGFYFSNTNLASSVCNARFKDVPRCSQWTRITFHFLVETLILYFDCLVLVVSSWLNQ